MPAIVTDCGNKVHLLPFKEMVLGQAWPKTGIFSLREGSILRVYRRSPTSVVLWNTFITFSACSAGNLSLIPQLGRSPGEGNGNSLSVLA